jgi:5-(carboxyamino)imidazole ribonucleotide synthase
VLKTTRLGYDGRGQAVLRDAADLDAAWDRLAPRPLILEAFIPFVREISAIAARGADGGLVTFDVTENRHANHILDLSIAPAPVPDAVAAAARGHVARLATRLELIGLLALEMFVLADGTVLANEMAPRPHNSGHWTMDACLCGQFEMHIRAVAGLPLPNPGRHHDAVMKNLVGPESFDRWAEVAGMEGVSLHLYGKAEARMARKLGHATRLLPLGSVAACADPGDLTPL